MLVRSDANVSPETLAGRITEQTGLKARTTQQFTRDGIDFIIENTGIPINFGITVVLGVIVGVAIVGLTFSLFIRDNIKQFGALKAIGVTNRKIMVMVRAIRVGGIDWLWFGIDHGGGIYGGGAAGSDDFQRFLHAKSNPADYCGFGVGDHCANRIYRHSLCPENRYQHGVQMADLQFPSMVWPKTSCRRR